MLQTRYFILRNQDAWVIRYGDEKFGPYKPSPKRCCLPLKLPESSGNTAIRRKFA